MEKDMLLIVLGVFFFLNILPSFALVNITSCSTLNVSGETYVLTQDIINSSISPCINISANNITLDCQGHLVDGNGSVDYGIYVSRSTTQTTNITIKNCVVSDWTYGVFFSRSQNNTLSNITLNSNFLGLFLADFSNSYTVTNITASSNDYGLAISESDNGILKDIIINASKDYGLYIGGVDNSNFSNIKLELNGYGLYMGGTSRFCNFFNITANSNNNTGIYLLGSENNKFTLITANSNVNYGILLNQSVNNILSNVTANSNNYGILLSSSNFTTLSNVTAESNGDYGINLVSSNNNTLTDVTARLNGWNGINVGGDYNTLSNILAESNGYYGVAFTGSFNKLTNGVIRSNGDFGMYFSYSNFNNFTNISVNSNNRCGIYLIDTSSNNTFSDINVSSNNGTGICIYQGANNNTFSAATVSSNNGTGIEILFSDNNIIWNSKIENNEKFGIYFDTAKDNKFYNNLFNNTNNFYFNGTIYDNYWNTTRQPGTRIYSPGLEIGGNYWTDPDGNYSDTCDDSDYDGFCDEPYVLVPDTNVDYLPLSDEYDEFTITLNSPDNNTVTSDTQPSFNFTATSLYHPTFSCTLYINNSAYGTNASVLNNTPTVIQANATLQDGSYNWYIACGHSRSETRVLNISTAPPPSQPPSQPQPVVVKSPVTPEFVLILFTLSLILFLKGKGIKS